MQVRRDQVLVRPGLVSRIIVGKFVTYESVLVSFLSLRSK